MRRDRALRPAPAFVRDRAVALGDWEERRLPGTLVSRAQGDHEGSHPGGGPYGLDRVRAVAPGSRRMVR